MSGGTPEEALQRALKFLGFRARSEQEVRVKLAQLGFPQRTVETTLERLLTLNLLNDEQFARAWALTRVERQGFGPLRVEKELRTKGVSQSLIDRIVGEAIGPKQGKERAQVFLEKRFGNKDLRDPKVRRRVVGLLQRRGYRDSVIAEVLQTTPDDE
jgi:regulatory protein